MRSIRGRLAGISVLACLFGAASVTVIGVPDALAAPLPAGSWGSARTVVLPPVINFGQGATINSIACPKAGDCTAVGHFTDAHDHRAAIAVSEANHTWAPAIQPFGTVESFATVPDLLSVSCWAPGNCTAVGVLTANSAWTEGMILDEVGGAWSESVYLSVDNKGEQVDSVSCPSASANVCAAGGSYVDAGGHTQGLLAVESNASPDGDWSALTAVPGLAALNTGGNASVASVSCPSAGNCAAAGFYTDGNGHQQAFVITEKKGAWGSAREVAGGLNASGGHAQVNSVSCASAGNCVAAGQYFKFVSPVASTQAFVVTEKAGIWSASQEVPGTAKLNTGGLALVNSVSCAPGGGSLNCALGGRYYDKNGHDQAFVDLLKNGAWQQAGEIAGGPNHGGYAQVSTVSCPKAGNCAAGGYYLTAPGSSQKYQAFLASLEGFSWKPVEEVPGTAALNKGMTAHVNSVSCPSTGFCAAGGFYSDGHFANTLPFTVDGSVTQPTTTTLALSAATVAHGHEQGEKISVKVSPAYAGPASGTVTIKAGSTVLCKITLASGAGSCQLGAKKLAPGTYHVVASYPGTTYLASSASATKTLKVTA
jgi:Bacterial Ig-like domain (group 3)